jgi:hypothetical protein
MLASENWSGKKICRRRSLRVRVPLLAPEHKKFSFYISEYRMRIYYIAQ